MDNQYQTEMAQLSDACFNYLVEDVEELSRFMAFSGHDPQSLRQAAGSQAMTTGMLDYFASNEQSLLALCEKHTIRVERFMWHWQRLNHHE